MLLLASTSDLLRVITSAAIAVDVHASWVDLNGTTATPGRTNTLITTAATTTVVGSPAASTYRTVKTLTLRNKGASANTVTIQHSDGTNIPELVKVILGPEEQLHYQEEAGWWITDSGFRKKIAIADLGGVELVTLAGDVTNANASANTIADVTGLSFPVLANKMYRFKIWVVYTAAATTTGSRWSINGPAATYLQYESEYSLTTAVPPTTTRNSFLSAYDLPAAANASSAATGKNAAELEGVIQPSAAGTVVVRFASEVASSAIVAKAGSFIQYQQITA